MSVELANNSNVFVIKGLYTLFTDLLQENGGDEIKSLKEILDNIKDGINGVGTPASRLEHDLHIFLLL